MGERSHLLAKSRTSYEGWDSFGSALFNDPFGTAGKMLVPGLMEAFRNPRSTESWGKAAVDIALIGVSVAKFGQAGKLANVGRIGEEVTGFGKAGSAAERIPSIDRSTSFMGRRSYPLDYAPYQRERNGIDI